MPLTTATTTTTTMVVNLALPRLIISLDCLFQEDLLGMALTMWPFMKDLSSQNRISSRHLLGLEDHVRDGHESELLLRSSCLLKTLIPGDSDTLAFLGKGRGCISCVHCIKSISSDHHVVDLLFGFSSLGPKLCFSSSNRCILISYWNTLCFSFQMTNGYLALALASFTFFIG